MAGATEMTEIFLVRHGRTALNAQGRFRGRQDVPLDDVGREQAREAARRLRGVSIAAVYAGPLLRTIQTAEPIAEGAGVEVAVEPALVDLDYGSWETLTEQEAEVLTPQAFRLFRDDLPHAVAPDGESLSAVEARVLHALRTIGELHPAASVIAVSHDVPIMLVVARLAGVEGLGIWTDARVATGSITKLAFSDGELSLVGGPGDGP